MALCDEEINRLNLLIVLDEANEMLKMQQNSIDLLYNKVNWILVSNIVLLVGMFSLSETSLISVTAISLSVTLLLVKGLNSRDFNYTQKISNQIEKFQNKNYIHELIEKKRQAFNSNKNKVSEISLILQVASTLLVLALAVQLLIMSL